MLVVLCCCSVNAQPLQVVYFNQYLEKKNSSALWASEKFCPVSTSLIARRVLESYGSMFVAHWYWTACAYAMARGCAAIIRARTPSKP